MNAPAKKPAPPRSPLSDADRARLDDFYRYIEEKSHSEAGYPSAMDYDYSELKDLLDYSLNNVGDPFVAGTSKVNSREFEIEALQFWARLMRAPQDDWWGYVTNGGTEGNLYGLYLARELYPKGIVYFSQDTHYSVTKNLHFLNMRNIMIRSQPNGEIDYDDLRETLKVNRDSPPIIFANIGTTMTEAKDDLGTINGILDELAIPNRYIHSDAAMCGSIAPFLEPRPRFDFADGADSIAISGHKFIGSPIPCGIVLAHRSHVNRIASAIAYIGNLDTTITGSRNGHTPVIMWYAIKTMGEAGLRARVQISLELAAYAERKFIEAGVGAWRNPDAITVVFPAVSEELQHKWQLATAGGISHMILMPNITRELIDTIVADVAAE
ncbi:MAG: histidine decarboxylase [Gammaproteobacteria bacterium]|nr:histidine decarboxylase [Gammaproteobacteria bacterium]